MTTRQFLLGLALLGACGGDGDPAGTSAVPAAPGPLFVMTSSNAALALSWRDNSANETEFEIEAAIDVEPYALVAALGADRTTYTLEGPVPNRYYKFRVRACNAGGCSGWSNESGRKSEYPPTGPVFTRSGTFELQARSSGLEVLHRPGAIDTEVVFEWARASDSLDGPNVTRMPMTRVSPVFGAEGEPVDVRSAQYVFGLEPATTYHFRARISNPFGTIVTPAREFTTRVET